MGNPALGDRLRGTLRQANGLYRALRFLGTLPLNLTLALVRALMPRRWFRLGPPKELYSEYELVLAGTIPGRAIYPKQKPPPLRPNSLRHLANLRQNECQPWPFFWSHRQNARLVSSSLALVDDKKRLCREAAFESYSLPGEPAYRYFALPPGTRLTGSWTSVVSRWGYGFYHWWMDVLPRLAVLDEFPPDTGILVHPKLDPYQVESLRLLGLAERVRLTPERHLLVEDYYFSSPTSMTGCWNPFAIDWLRQKFLPCADQKWEGPRRFYIQRIGRTRGLANEPEVIALFREKGWAILDLETLPVPRQIQLFAQAEFVCGLHGAAFVNLLWAQPGCRVLELCASTYLNGVYEGIAEHLNLHYRHLVCPADGTFVARVDIQQLRRTLDALEQKPA